MSKATATLPLPSRPVPPPPERDAAHDERALGALARRGVLWSVVGYGGSQILRFGVNLLLTRLLLQEAFGLLALVNAFLQGLQLFSDVGLGLSIIQSKRGDDRRFLDTAWTLQVGRGLCLWLATCACAAPFARFYDNPSLFALLTAAGVTALVSGFNSTKLFTMNRHLAMARLTLIELASQIAGMTVMVVWALSDPSPWALVSGGIMGTLVKMVLSHAVLPGVGNRLHWEKESALSLFRFGRWVLFSTLLTFLVGQSDRLIFGKMIPLDLLGVYSIAGVLASMPVTAIGQVAGTVVFPMYSRIHNAGDALAPVFMRVRWPLLVVTGWMISGLTAGGPTIVRLLYDERYAQAGWIVQLLGCSSWFFLLEASNGSAMLAKGKVGWLAAGNVGKLVGMVALIPLGYALGGFPGAVAGFASSELVKYAVSLHATRREGLKGWVQDIKLSLLAACAIGLGAGSAAFLAAEGVPSWLCAVSVFLMVTLTWLPAGAGCWREYKIRRALG